VVPALPGAGWLDLRDRLISIAMRGRSYFQTPHRTPGIQSPITCRTSINTMIAIASQRFKKEVAFVHGQWNIQCLVGLCPLQVNVAIGR